MSECKMESIEKETQDSVDYLEIEFLDSEREKINRISSEQEAKIIDIYHKQKAKEAAIISKRETIIRYSHYAMKL